MNAKHQLKVHVERIVRPIRASEKDKLRMREELYAHAVDAFEHEQSTGADEAAAVSRAVERLGDPDATRDELQATVGWQSRNAWWNDRVMRRAANESLLRHATKVGLLTSAALLVYQILLFVPLEFAEFRRWTLEAQLLVRMGLALAGMMGAGMFFGAIFSDVGSRLAKRSYAQHGDWLRALLILVGSTILTCVIGWCFTFAVSSDYAASWEIAAHWLILGAVASPAFLVLSWLDFKERRPLAEWLELDLNT